MFVTFTQGGTPVNVTLNSVVATGAVTSMGDPNYAVNVYFRWNVRTSMDVVGLHLVFNVTIGGVGMVLEMDYPIAAPVTPELEWLYGPAWSDRLGEECPDDLQPIPSESTDGNSRCRECERYPIQPRYYAFRF